MRRFDQSFAALVALAIALTACSSTATVSDRKPSEAAATITQVTPAPVPTSLGAVAGAEADRADAADTERWTIDDAQIADVDLQVGTCVASALVEEGKSLELISCELTHGAEIFHREPIAPGEYTTYESAERRCEEKLVPLVEPYGLTREPSGSAVVAFQASDRLSFVCTIGSGFTGSFVRGTVTSLAGVSYEENGSAVGACTSDCSVNAVADLELQVSHVQALDDGRALAIGIDGAGWIWGTGISDEPISLEPVTTYTYDFQGTFDSVADGRILLGSYQGGSYLWDLVAGESQFLAFETAGEIGPYAQVAMPDGRLLFEGLSSWVAFDASSLDAGAQLLPEDTPGGTIDAVAIGDGRVFAATYDGLFAWDPSGTIPAVQIDGDIQDPFGVNAVVSDGKALVMVVGDDGLVLVIDLAERSQTKLVGLEHHVDAAVVLENGRVAAGDWSGAIAIWDIAEPATPITVLSGHEFEVTSLAQLPDGRLLSAGNDGTIRTWILDE